jgi:hypothetical protein
VGGDCYDAVPIGDFRFSLSIGDVSGKGLPAALVMSHLQACTRAFGGDARTPRDLVSRVNRSLCEAPRLETFVTFCYLVLDLAGRTLTFSNAGHNPPILIRRDGTVVRLTAGGLMLGVLAGALYDEGELALGARDRVVLFTDRLTVGDQRSLDAGTEADEEIPVPPARRDQHGARPIDEALAERRGPVHGRGRIADAPVRHDAEDAGEHRLRHGEWFIGFGQRPEPGGVRSCSGASSRWA